MRNRRRLAAALGVTLAGLAGGAAGCGGSGGDGLSDLRIGVLVPLTGALDDFGGPGAEAARIAGEEVNRAAEDAGLECACGWSSRTPAPTPGAPRRRPPS